ncbi:MAG: phosphatidate cytidylyltransferase [Crocinitomix sp.]|nr:phosphatidate cytidylyltransferase [Crocinitomix sp.]
MTQQELINMAIYTGLFLALFAIAELLYHYAKVYVEITRKTVHLGTGLITLSFPIFLTTHWSVLILTVSFVVILALSKKFNLLKSINGITRTSRGSILYPIIIYTTYLIFTLFDDVLFFYLPILILAICDPIAALTGKKWPIGKFKIFKETKTLMGSSCFFISCVILTTSFVIPLRDNWFEITCVTLFISIVTTVVEAASQKGWDNLFIPLSVTASLLLSQYLFHF